MSFAEENIPAFLENFEIIKDKIRNAPGNRLLGQNQQMYFLYLQLLGNRRRLGKLQKIGAF
jgi:hypothetical protein